MFKRLKIWDDENALKQVVRSSYSITETLKKLGVSELARSNAVNLKESIKRFNLDTSHFRSQHKKIWEKHSIAPIIQRCLCLSDVLLELGISTRSGNFVTLKQKIEEYNISTSHFDPVLAGQKRKRERGYGHIPLKEILEGKHPHYKSYHLKQRLLREGLKQPICEMCGLGEKWNGMPINHDLDHINGNSTDHRFENLCLLCPNCHSQTPTFKGKNKRISS